MEFGPNGPFSGSRLTRVFLECMHLERHAGYISVSFRAIGGILGGGTTFLAEFIILVQIDILPASPEIKTRGGGGLVHLFYLPVLSKQTRLAN